MQTKHYCAEQTVRLLNTLLHCDWCFKIR